MVKRNDDGFVTVTNHDVYCKILDLEKTIGEFNLNNQKQHSEIIKRQDYTNGSVKTSKWIASTALTLTIVLLGFLFNHLSAVAR